MGVFAVRRTLAVDPIVAGFTAATFGVVVAFGFTGCRSTAPPRVVSAIGIATDPRTATAQTLAGERAKKNLALLLGAKGTRFTYVSQGGDAVVEAGREGRASLVRTQYRSLSQNTWLAVAKASRTAEEVRALGAFPFREHDVTVRDENLVRAYHRAEASLLRALVEATLGPRALPTFVTGQILFIDLVPDFGQDWVRLAARARVQIEDERRPTARELGRLRGSADPRN